MDYVLQDDQGHSVKELVLPPNRKQYIEIQYLCKTHFRLDTLIFDCEGELNEKPLAKERVNEFVAVGKNRWVPGQDDTDIIDRKGGYHIKVDGARNVGTWRVVGFELQTQRVGVYKANVSFVADELEGNDTLTIRVEDTPTTKRLRCLVSHKNCYPRVIHPK